MKLEILQFFKECSYSSLIILFIISLLYFVESLERSIFSIALVPYINYSSYEYSLLVGPIFTVVYSLSGVFLSFLFDHFEEKKQKNNSNTNGKSQISQSNSPSLLPSSITNNPSKLLNIYNKLKILIYNNLNYFFLSLSTIIFSLAFYLTIFSTKFYHIVIIRIIMGINQSIITPLSINIIKNNFVMKFLSISYTIFNSTSYFSYSFLLSVNILIYNLYGWKLNYIIFGILGLILGVCLPFFIIFDNKNIKNDEDLSPLLISPNNKLYNNSSFSMSSNLSDFSHSPIFSKLINRNSSFHKEISSSSTDVATSSSSSLPSSSSSTSLSNSTASNVSPVHPSTVSPSFSSQNLTSSDSNNNFLCRENEIILPSSSSTSPSDEEVTDTILKKLHFIIFRHFLKFPSVFIIYLATGFRLAGGYIWSSYTFAYFSDFYTTDPDYNGSCKFSYNTDNSFTSSSNDTSTFSSLYTLLNTSITSSRSLASNDGICTSDYPYCVDGDCKSLTEFPWHGKGMDNIVLISYMSWVPIVGSAFGSIICGIIIDKIVKKYEKNVNNNSNIIDNLFLSYRTRILSCSLSCFLSLPLVLISLYLQNPYCFLILILSGFIGEIYFSQALTIISSDYFLPSKLLTSGVAFFMLVITIIGSSSPLLVSYLLSTSHFNNNKEYIIKIKDFFPNNNIINYSVINNDYKDLQSVLLILLFSSYFLSGLFYFISYFFLFPDKKEKEIVIPDVEEDEELISQ